MIFFACKDDDQISPNSSPTAQLKFTASYEQISLIRPTVANTELPTLVDSLMGNPLAESFSIQGTFDANGNMSGRIDRRDTELTRAFSPKDEYAHEGLGWHHATIDDGRLMLFDDSGLVKENQAVTGQEDILGNVASIVRMGRSMTEEEIELGFEKFREAGVPVIERDDGDRNIIIELPNGSKSVEVFSMDHHTTISRIDYDAFGNVIQRTSRLVVGKSPALTVLQEHIIKYRSASDGETRMRQDIIRKYDSFDIEITQ